MNYDIIIDSQIGWGASSASYVLERLRELKGRPVRVYVSSFGGAVADAFRIQQAFREHGDVTCYLVSFVASAATLLTLGAKRIILDPSCLYLAHKCSYYIDEYGQMNEDELREAIARLAKNADDLVTIDKVAANLYAARSGKTEEEMVAIMKEARWLSCDEVLRLGLADEVQTIVSADSQIAQALANISALGLPDIPQADVSEENAEEDDASAADEAEEEEAKDTFNLGVSEMLHSLFSKTFGAKRKQKEEEPQNTQEDMKEDTQTTQQTVENTAAEERIAALEKENAELKAQLDALAAQDGDDTTANAGEASEATADTTLGNVREAYERLRGIL